MGSPERCQGLPRWSASRKKIKIKRQRLSLKARKQGPGQYDPEFPSSSTARAWKPSLFPSRKGGRPESKELALSLVLKGSNGGVGEAEGNFSAEPGWAAGSGELCRLSSAPKPLPVINVT